MTPAELKKCVSDDPATLYLHLEVAPGRLGRMREVMEPVGGCGSPGRLWGECGRSWSR